MTRPGLVVAGLDRLSVTDWPGRRVATVLTQGCPWRCGYCHHPGLCAVAAPGGAPPQDTVPWSEGVALLAPRRPRQRGVLLSGGRPPPAPGPHPPPAYHGRAPVARRHTQPQRQGGLRGVAQAAEGARPL